MTDVAEPSHAELEFAEDQKGVAIPDQLESVRDRTYPRRIFAPSGASPGSRFVFQTHSVIVAKEQSVQKAN